MVGIAACARVSAHITTGGLHMAHRLSVAIAVTCLILATTAHADINEGLVSAWTFDGIDANDAYKNSDGILHDGASITDDGMIGKALDVDGVDGYCEVPDVDAFDVMEEAYTVSAWMNVRAGRDHSAIVCKGVKVGGGANFTVRICTVSDTDMTWGACAGGTEGWFRTDGVYEVGEWTHVCETVDGSQAIGYVNAEVVPSGGQANPLAIGAPYNLFKDNPFEFGVGRQIGGNLGNDSYLDGTIDEIYLYDRALSEEEVAELATGARPGAVDGALGVDANGKAATIWGTIKARN